jgi:hypothetical protein
MTGLRNFGMKTKDLMERVRFIVDPQGNQSGVLLNVEDWEQLLILLEDMEDAEEIQQARETDEEEILLTDFSPDPLAHFIGATCNGNLASAIDDTLYG